MQSNLSLEEGVDQQASTKKLDARHRHWNSFGSNGNAESPCIGAHYGPRSISRGGSAELGHDGLHTRSCHSSLAHSCWYDLLIILTYDSTFTSGSKNISRRCPGYGSSKSSEPETSEFLTMGDPGKVLKVQIAFSGSHGHCHLNYPHVGFQFPYPHAQVYCSLIILILNW